MIDFKGHRFEKDIALIGVHWYLIYSLSDRYLAAGKRCPLQKSDTLAS